MANKLGGPKNPLDWKAGLLSLVQLAQLKTAWPGDVAEPRTTISKGQRPHGGWTHFVKRQVKNAQARVLSKSRRNL